MNTDKTTMTASAPETRIYATLKSNGERVEVIGEDSSDNARALILSVRGFTSYVLKSELNTASASQNCADEIDGQPLVTHKELVRRMCEEGDPRHAMT